MNIEKIICEKVVSSGVRKPAIMLNGRYMMHNGKQVHLDANIVDVDKISFRYFVRQYNGELDRSEEIEVSSQTFIITREIGGDSLFGVRMPFVQKKENANITVNTEYGVLIIESSYYQMGQKLQDVEGNVSLSIGDDVLDSDSIAALRRVFFENALVNYRDVVYSTTTNKFAKHLIARNKFYGIRPTAFVPVFINLDWLYNPLQNKELAVEQTRMYRIAQEKGRYLESNGVSAYFMTHLEICQAFGMTHFARFSPSLWFNLFIGLLQPTNSNFPNKLSKLALWSSEQQPPKELKKSYSVTEFENVYNMYSETLPEELKQYVIVDSLDAYVSKESNAIKTIGATYLDARENTTVPKLCEYYAEAKLLY